ncbi:histidine kinase [Lacinutrix neustonica]|uniref:Histidine kinase n=1 Tax=Lacinutrix neustonica TaxID=2980107 RepID=A0A9E8MYG4_9FLAO|nr:histidine kinase [Lacinutrix neustonica]WAC03686.1 histidine kinase [Lacinutrix neustonica]
MKQIITYLYLLFLLCGQSVLMAQSTETEKRGNRARDLYFSVSGFVRENDTYKPVNGVNIQVNGGAYTSSNLAGEFRIKAKKGDELIISHEDFETIYYIIQNDASITVDVMPRKVPSDDSLFKSKKTNSFHKLIDSATAYKKISAEKSMRFIIESIKNSSSVKENAQAFEVLGDVNMYWKQYDLAVSNYRISLNSFQSNKVKLKLGEAYMYNNNYQESVAIYKTLNKNELSNYQKVELFEGLGDVYFKMNDYKKAIATYNEGLNLAQQHLITPKVTDLNSKIAQTFDASGSIKEAKAFYSNSLNLASKQNKKRSVEEKIKVADFNNSKAEYDDEIKLREEAILDIRDIETEAAVDNESDFTTQKQNYKIGNALFLQKNYVEAIPYLEKSIAEADKREDLVVVKDAKRKLSEVYDVTGNYEKAYETYKAYTASVEELYVKKNQEIAQAARYAKRIAENQNRIVSLEKDRELSEGKYQLNIEQNKNQKIIIYSLIGGLLLLLLTAYLMYKYIKQQKLANNLLALKSLRSRMNPHFIFNALNSVNSFIASNDERTANKYLSDFSKLMRAVLENSEEDFIPLQKEIELLELYTKLEHFRFQDKFDYNISVDKTIAIDNYKIPPMLLQPYIENAVWHGLRYKKEKGFLDIAIVKTGEDEIAITISDNGIGREKVSSLKN